MEKKRALKVNLIALAAVLAIILAAVLIGELMPREIEPDAGALITEPVGDGEIDMEITLPQ